VEGASDGAQRAALGAETVTEARDASVRIDARVQDISERVKRITAATQQIVASATDLNQTAGQLQSLLSQFTLPTDR